MSVLHRIGESKSKRGVDMLKPIVVLYVIDKDGEYVQICNTQEDVLVHELLCLANMKFYFSEDDEYVEKKALIKGMSRRIGKRIEETYNARISSFHLDTIISWLNVGREKLKNRRGRIEKLTKINATKNILEHERGHIKFEEEKIFILEKMFKLVYCKVMCIDSITEKELEESLREMFPNQEFPQTRPIWLTKKIAKREQSEREKSIEEFLQPMSDEEWEERQRDIC